MFCIHCGKQLPDGVRFCTNCGAPVKTKPQTPPEPAVTPPPPPVSTPSTPSVPVPPALEAEPSAAPFTPPAPPQTPPEPDMQAPLEDEPTEMLGKTTIPTFDSDMDPEATMLFIPGSLSHHAPSHSASSAPPSESMWDSTPTPPPSEPMWSSNPTPPPSEPMWSNNPTPPSSEPAWNSTPTPPPFYPPQRDVPPPEAMGYEDPMQPPRKKRSALPVVVAILLILAALAAVAVFYFTQIAPASEKDAEPSQSLAVSAEEPSDTLEPSSTPSSEPSATPAGNSSFRAETLTGSYYSASNANDYLNLRMNGDQLSILLQVGNQALLNLSIAAPDAPVFEVTDNNQLWTFYCSPSEGLVTLVNSNITYQFSQTASAVPSPTVSTPLNGDYLFPTDSQYITNADLDNFTQQEIVLLRNEIYARHGCNFQDETIRNYFLSKSWYHPVEGLNASTFSSTLFNDYESANVDTILAYERTKGWRT